MKANHNYQQRLIFQHTLLSKIERTEITDLAVILFWYLCCSNESKSQQGNKSGELILRCYQK